MSVEVIQPFDPYQHGYQGKGFIYRPEGKAYIWPASINAHHFNTMKKLYPQEYEAIMDTGEGADDFIAFYIGVMGDVQDWGGLTQLERNAIHSVTQPEDWEDWSFSEDLPR
jgi:hypothetical protein